MPLSYLLWPEILRNDWRPGVSWTSQVNYRDWKMYCPRRTSGILFCWISGIDYRALYEL